MNTQIQYLENAVSFRIETPMVKNLHSRICQWTWCGLTGGLIVGDSRCGKSTALRILEDEIQSRSDEPIKLFRVSYGERDAKSIRSVFCKIARSLKYQVKASHSSDDLLEMICNRMAEAALSNSIRQVVMTIDEAQMLTIEQISVFAEIYNDLCEMDVNGVFYFVANKDQMEELASELLKKKNDYLRERFFAHLYEFRGIMNVEELKQCLKGYDQYIVDIEDNLTATQYYCPRLYSRGWRLSNIAKPYWQLYCEGYKKPLGHNSWGMGHFVRATTILLKYYLSHYNTLDDQAVIKACIVKSLEGAAIKPTLVSLAS